MTTIFGEMKGKLPFREIVKSPTISVLYGFKLELERNDVPVTLFYKHKNNTWKTLLINNEFTPEAVPHNSDIYLSASLNREERVIFAIEH